MRVDMRQWRTGTRGGHVWLLLSLAVVAAGCGKSPPGGDTAAAPKFEVADDGEAPAKPAAPAELAQPAGRMPPSPAPPAVASQAPLAGRPQPPSIPGNQLDAAAGTTAAELVEQMNQLEERILSVQMQIQRGEADMTAMRAVLESVLDVSSRILASDADQEARQRAVEAKKGALIVLRQISRDRPWNEEIATFANSLLTDADPAIAVEGRVILLWLLVGDVSEGKSQDVEGLVAQVRALMANEARGPSALEVGGQAVIALRNANRDAEARTVFELVAQAFQDHPDPRLAGEAADMRQHLLLFDLGLDSAFSDVVANKEGAAATFVDTLTKALADPGHGRVTLEKVSYCVLVLEQSGNFVLARQVCDMVKAAYEDHAVADVRTSALQWADLTLRRLSLLDTPLALAGTRLDGTPFDATPYQGKLVVVAFWVASPSCQQELVGLKALYEQYRDQGLEVIGVYVPAQLAGQPDVTAANSFVNQTQLPWVNLTLGKDDWERFAVELVPYLLLVDRQGTIRELAVRVKSLKDRLPALLQ